MKAAKVIVIGWLTLMALNYLREDRHFPLTQMLPGSAPGPAGFVDVACLALIVIFGWGLARLFRNPSAPPPPPHDPGAAEPRFDDFPPRRPPRYYEGSEEWGNRD